MSRYLVPTYVRPDGFSNPSLLVGWLSFASFLVIQKLFPALSSRVPLKPSDLYQNRNKSCPLRLHPGNRDPKEISCCDVSTPRQNMVSSSQENIYMISILAVSVTVHTNFDRLCISRHRDLFTAQFSPITTWRQVRETWELPSESNRNCQKVGSSFVHVYYTNPRMTIIDNAPLLWCHVPSSTWRPGPLVCETSVL